MMKLKKFNLKSIFGRLMLSHLIIIFISLTVIGILFGYLVQNYYHGLRELEATNSGRRIAQLVSENISGGSIGSEGVDLSEDKINTIARSSNMDIGLMNAEGEMILNAPTIKDFNLTLEDNEIDYVLEGNTLTKKIMGLEYKNLLMLIPLLEDDDEIVIMEPKPQETEAEIVGSLIILTPLGSVGGTVNNIIRLILYSFLVAIIAAVFLSFSFSKRITRPLAEIQSSALQSAEGNFQEVRVPENGSEEIKHLVNTYNYAVTQINENLEKRKKLEKMRKELVANVSHEFRAPLTSIKGFLEIIQEQEPSGEEIDEYVDIMYKDTEYLEHLLSDLLILGQLESTNSSLNKEEVNPHELVRRAVNSIKKAADQKEIDIKFEYDGKLPVIRVDKNRIHQVIINILENAINYSPAESEIVIRVEEVDIKGEKKVKFTVSDQGPGIPEEEKENIWQRFYKIDRARTREQQKGSGLGLAIVKDIVNRHGGEVDVESKPGEGSTFIFII
ncbi:MAG: ATP-binding protein [Halanaerobiales bacterium]